MIRARNWLRLVLLISLLVFGLLIFKHLYINNGPLFLNLDTLQPSAGWRVLSETKLTTQHPKLEELSVTCLEDLYTKAGICPELNTRKRTKKMDIVYTWTNGSDPLLSAWRESLKREEIETKTDEKPQRSDLDVRKGGAHFSEHDELRYSIRSILKYFPRSSIQTIHLVTAGLPYQIRQGRYSENHNSTIVQVPHWLKPNISISDIGFQLVSHIQLWGGWNPSLPSFNSLAIEAQLSNIPNLSDIVIYMNDDVFFLKKLNVFDFYCPISGPVFRVQPDLIVQPTVERTVWGAKQMQGEWPGLMNSARLLELRFGKRPRPYLAHIAKTFATSIWTEARSLWENELDATSRSRFRAMLVREELQLPFLVTHYTMEKHRETLLYSFLVYRCDLDGDGYISDDEWSLMMKEIGLDSDNPSIIYPPARSSIVKLHTGSGNNTKLLFSSMDGYGLVYLPTGHYCPDGAKFQCKKSTWNPPILDPADKNPSETFGKCTLRSSCFTDDNGPIRDTIALWKRITFQKTRCGDCLIMLLMGKTRLGIETFLPTANYTNSVSVLRAPEFGRMSEHAVVTSDGLYQDLLPTKLTSSPRETILRLLYRYRYTLGETPSALLQMHDSGSFKANLCDLNPIFAQQYCYFHRGGEPIPAILTINDDIPSKSRVIDFEKNLHRFFQTEWGDVDENQSPWES